MGRVCACVYALIGAGCVLQSEVVNKLQPKIDGAKKRVAELTELVG